mmetsp:Transcript_402/g.1037  ORF Transcript_402/g.1037 Transcript_402/m.1037 type:complete len:239 (+) Transcript_402:353-1069(+)
MRFVEVRAKVAAGAARRGEEEPAAYALRTRVVVAPLAVLDVARNARAAFFAGGACRLRSEPDGALQPLEDVVGLGERPHAARPLRFRGEHAGRELAQLEGPLQGRLEGHLRRVAETLHVRAHGVAASERERPHEPPIGLVAEDACGPGGLGSGLLGIGLLGVGCFLGSGPLGSAIGAGLGVRTADLGGRRLPRRRPHSAASRFTCATGASPSLRCCYGGSGRGRWHQPQAEPHWGASP